MHTKLTTAISEARRQEPEGSYNERTLHAAALLVASIGKTHGSGAWRGNLGRAASIVISLLSGARAADPYIREQNDPVRP